MLTLFPAGFEEIGRDGSIELAAYADAAGEEALRALGLGAVTVTEVEEGWEDRWREFHQPTVIGRLWVGPPWEEPASGLVPVIIDPGRAFGTGAHATTRLCLELLQERLPGSTIDVGCGSGVLSIAAALLGHRPVLAVDDDPLAVEASGANAAVNGVAAHVEARLMDASQGILPTADLALANLSLAVVEAVAPRLRTPLLIASGYLGRDVPTLPGWRRLDRRTQEGCAADLLERIVL
jgi:ribosomal protein L11 methyltransferase